MENLMRKLFMLLVLPLSVLIITSCGSDDDDDSGSSIVGFWNATELTKSECANPDDNGTETFEPGDATFSFGTGGDYTFVLIEGSMTETENGTYTISGSNIELCAAGATICENFQWSISGSELTLTGSEGDCSIIVTLTRS